MVKINGESSKKKVLWYSRNSVSKLFLYLDIGVEVPELVVEWTILTQNPELIGKIVV